MYETGFGLALLLWVVGNALWIAERLSLRNRNLRKLGLRLSLTGEVTPMNSYDANRAFWVRALKFCLFSFVGLLCTLTSWLYVAMYLGGMAWRWSKQAGAPAANKEFIWRLRNIDMSVDELIRQSMKVNGRPEEEFEVVRRDVLRDLEERGLA